MTTIFHRLLEEEKEFPKEEFPEEPIPPTTVFHRLAEEEKVKKPIPEEILKKRPLELTTEEFKSLPFEEKARISREIGEQAREETSRAFARGAIPGLSYLERLGREQGIIPEDEIITPIQRFLMEMAGETIPLSAIGSFITRGAKILFPASQIGKMATTIGGWAAAGAGYDAVQELAREGKTPTASSLAKSGAFWGTFESVLQGLPYIGRTASKIVRLLKRKKPKNVGQIAENTNQLLELFKKRGGSIEDLTTNIPKAKEQFNKFLNEQLIKPRLKLEKEIVKPGLTAQQIKNREFALKHLKQRELEFKKDFDLTGKVEGIGKEIGEVTAEKPTIKPPEINPEQAINEQILRKDETAKALDKFAAKFNVEYPFKKIGASETGFRIKTYYDQISKNIEIGKEVQKKIKKLDLSKSELSQLALLAEMKEIPKDPRLKAGYQEVRKYFDNTLKQLKETKILKEGFVENQKRRIREEIQSLEAAIKKEPKDQLKGELRAAEQQLKDIENVEFVSIPARLWFAEKSIDNPALARRVIRFLNKRKRKTATIASLIESGAISPEEININDIIAYYSRKSGRDLALAKIIQAAKKDGLASLEAKPGFIKFPAYIYPELAKYNLHPAFADYLQDFTNPKRFTAYDKLVNRLKGWAFYNPLVLPSNDIVQHAMAVIASPKNILKLPKYWFQGIRDFVKKTPRYWEAYENGLFSQPFVMREKNFRFLMEDIKRPQKYSLPQAILKSPITIHEKIYEAAGNLAWGMDKSIRMMTFNAFLDRGKMSVREAAQTAAHFHGDYARINPKTRRTLNKFFFTPTFKIVMGSLYKDMTTAIPKIGKAILKGEKIKPADKAKLTGLAGAGAILYGIDQFLTKGLGFRREQFGRKYSKLTKDDEGISKDFTLTFSHPANLPLKFIYRGMEAFAPIEERPFWAFVRKNRFELAKPLKIGMDLVSNKDDHFKPIFDRSDSFSKQGMDMINHIFNQTFPLIRQLGDRDQFVDEKSRKAMEKEIGKIGNWLPFMFGYLTTPKKIRSIKKVKYMTNQMMKKQMRLRREGKKMDEKEIKRWKERIRKTLED